VVWVGAMVSAGLLMVLLFFSFIGEVNFAYAYVAGVLIVFLAAYFLVTWGTFEHSRVKGNTRPEDRERRGF
jgi:high-affinity Fe2+/Pb2+ permease